MWNSKASGYLAALLATVLWSGNFIIARGLADAMPPWQLNFWRWLVAFLVMLPFGWRNFIAERRCVTKHAGYMLWMGLIGVTLMNTLIYKAGQTTPSLNMALIMPATPAVILLLARLMYKEKISAPRLLGMVIAMGGIILLIARGSLATLIDLSFTAGDIWCIGGMLCFALYSIFMRQRPEKLSPTSFNLWVFLIGLVLSLPGVIWETATQPPAKVDVILIVAILYAGLGCSALAFWLWTVGIERIGAVRAAIVYYSLPVFTAIQSWYILHESASLIQLTGGALIICGIFLASLPKRGGSAGTDRQT